MVIWGLKYKKHLLQLWYRALDENILRRFSMNDMKVYPIGKIENENNEVKIILDPSYKKGSKRAFGL